MTKCLNFVTILLVNSLKQTEIHPSPNEYRVDPGSAEHSNYAIVRPAGETLDADKIQLDLASYVKTLGLEGKYDIPLGEGMLLGEVEVDPSILLHELNDAPEALSELTKFCAHMASSLGFENTATLSVGIQGDKHDEYNNINEVPHRDGARGEVGSQSASIRFVYPIGRPGSIIFPEVHEDGVTGKQVSSEDRSLRIERTTADPNNPSLPPRFLPSGDTEIVTSADEIGTDSGALQILPGNLLVFDMTNSPWHAAPEPTIDGAIFTVDVRQATPLETAA